MSSAPDQPQTSGTLAQAQHLAASAYTLHSDLAKLCLPSATRDEQRRLSWVNSICFFFLLIGAIGVKTRPIAEKTVEEPAEIVPVVFTPPAEPPKVEPEPQVQEPDQTQEVTIETPQVATLVAADPSAVNFAVPVEGPVVFAPARFAAAPPPSPPKPATRPRPTVFRASGSDQGSYPDPPYPSLALRRHYEGKLLLNVVVDPSGIPASVEVKESSGFSILDTHSLDWVKNRWRWPPGDTRYYLVPIHYQIR